jgi:hypothetical protein
MTDAEKIEAEIQQLLATISVEGCDSVFTDLIAEKVKAYGELRYDEGYDAGCAEIPEFY